MPPVRFETLRPVLDVPFKCACCLAPPEDEMTVTAQHRGMMTKTYTRFGIPYCKPCIAHVRGFELSWLGGLLGAAAAVFAAYKAQPVPIEKLENPAIWAGIALFIVAAPILKTLLAPLLSRAGANCAGTVHAVWASGRGVGTPTYVFTCQNETWGAEAKRLNES